MLAIPNAAPGCGLLLGKAEARAELGQVACEFLQPRRVVGAVKAARNFRSPRARQCLLPQIDSELQP